MQKSWPLPLKWLFLVLFFYLILYVNSCQFITTFVFESIWSEFVPSFAKWMGYTGEMNTKPTGSGDKIYDYYKLFVFLLLAQIFASLFLLFDIKRTNYKGFFDALLVLLRYYIALQMISYGLAKIFYMQFGFPNEGRLDQTLGEFSPMGLLWTFMGFSKPYTIFTGILEFVAGILLLSRRTALLGALMSFGVMLNVMMMNFCYDVPVKLLSSHLVFMSLIIIASRGQSLFAFFIQNKSTPSNAFHDIVPEKYRTMRSFIKWMLLIIYIGFMISARMAYKKRMNAKVEKKAFHTGKFDVRDFEIYENRDTLLEYYIPRHKEWVYFYQLYQGYAQVITSDDQKWNFSFSADTTRQQYKLISKKDSAQFTLDYKIIDDNNIQLHGHYENDSLSMTLKRKTLEDYLLVNRGFHWVNEVPFNR